MPEGDSIFRAASALARALQGRTVTHFETAYAQLARFDDQAAIAGRTVEKVEAMGKHLLMRFSGGLTLRTHMRMNGSWHIYRPGERWQRPRRDMRIVVGTDAYVAVAFNVPVAEFLDDRALARSGALNRLGPDLLGGSFDPAAALASLRARGDLLIHEALLDQTVLAGIGNVYRSELLFMTGLHPDTPVAAIAEDRLAQLVALARKLLQANVQSGASAAITTYSGLRRTTGRADEGQRLWVYSRRGKPCRKCGAAIEYRKVGAGARGLYFCPRCQPLPDG
jgi:endonuclease VIII